MSSGFGGGRDMIFWGTTSSDLCLEVGLRIDH